MARDTGTEEGWAASHQARTPLLETQPERALGSGCDRDGLDLEPWGLGLQLLRARASLTLCALSTLPPHT